MLLFGFPMGDISWKGGGILPKKLYNSSQQIKRQTQIHRKTHTVTFI